jgi:hypothetical protein
VAAPAASADEACEGTAPVAVAAVTFAPDEPQYTTGRRYWCAAVVALALSAGAGAALVRLVSALGAVQEPGEAPEDLSARWAAFAAIYLLYLVEALCAQCAMEHGVLRFLGNVHAAEERHEELQYFDRMRRTRPRLEMHIECFHHETEHVTVTEEDSEGRSRSRTETRRHKVVTFRASEDKTFTQWLDFSSVGPRQVSGSTAIGVLVHVHKRVEPADPETVAAFQQQLRAFVLRHAWRDHEYTVTESTTYEGYRSALFMVEPTRKHRCMSTEVYVLCSLLLLSLPFRAWLFYHTVPSDWTLHTKVTVRGREEYDLAVPDALAAYEATPL